MIDEIRIFSLPITINELINNTWLEFPKNLDESGAFNNRNQTVNFRDLVFTINKEKQIRKLRGSLHKYKNEGLHNYDDFSFQDVKAMIEDIQEKFAIDPAQCKLSNVEYGINIKTDFDPTNLISDLIQHGLKPFIPMPKGIGCSARHCQYTIKIYNKGSQYGLPYFLLRIEIRVERMEYLQSKGIPVYYLADLLGINIQKKLAGDLLKRFKDILFYDSTIEIDRLKSSDQIILSNGRNPEYWEQLPAKSKRDNFRKKYNSIYKEHVQRDWCKIVSPLIKQKTDQLINNTLTLNDSIAEVSNSGNSFVTNPIDTIITKVSDSVKSNIIIPEKDDKKDKVSDSVFSQVTTQLTSDQLEERTDCIWDVESLEDFFISQKLPETIQLDMCTRIIDPHLFVQSHLRAIKAHNGHETYLPCYQRLIQAKDLLERGSM